MSVSDTSPQVEALRLKILRGMSGEQRLRNAVEMSELTRRLARARIVQEHPDWNEDRVIRELLRIAFLPAPLPAKLR